MKQNRQFVDDVKMNIMLNKHLYNVRNRKVKPNTKGSYSYCYYFGDHVLLKNMNKTEMTPELQERLSNHFLQRKNIIDMVKKDLNVNTPTPVCCFFGKFHYYEIQEKAPGSVLSIYYPSTARVLINKMKNVLDSSSTPEELENEQKISPAEAREIGKGVFLYNINMQKQLKNCPQTLFDKFVRDFRLLLYSGISVDVSRAENFLFDKEKGFSFVDLEQSSSPMCKMSHYQIAQTIYSAFNNFTQFFPYMDAKQIKIILKNMDAIYEKVYKAFENNKLEFTKEEQKILLERTQSSKKTIKELEK